MAAQNREPLRIADLTRGVEDMRHGPNVSITPAGDTLRVEYKTVDPNAPPSRDTWTPTTSRDWRDRRALRLTVSTPVPLALSVSFMDGNEAGYTQRTAQIPAGENQVIELPFTDFWFNKFGPPGKVPGAPLDLSNVTRFGFAPVNAEGGEFTIGQFEVID